MACGRTAAGFLWSGAGFGEQGGAAPFALACPFPKGSSTSFLGDVPCPR